MLTLLLCRRSIRSLLKASVSAEASERMSDVHEAKELAENRLTVERDILKDQAARVSGIEAGGGRGVPR